MNKIIRNVQVILFDFWGECGGRGLRRSHRHGWVYDSPWRIVDTVFITILCYLS